MITFNTEAQKPHQKFLCAYKELFNCDVQGFMINKLLPTILFCGLNSRRVKHLFLLMIMAERGIVGVKSRVSA